MLARLLELLGRLRPMTLVAVGAAGGIGAAILLWAVVARPPYLEIAVSRQAAQEAAEQAAREQQAAREAAEQAASEQQAAREAAEQAAREQQAAQEAAEQAQQATRGLPSGPPSPLADSRTLEILYATNRAMDRSGARLEYTSDRAHELSFGIARVQLPNNHREGAIERPWRFRILAFEIGTSEDPKKHFTLRGLQELDRDAFIDTIKEAKRDTALVFVHGYNNKFDDGVFRIAQIVWDGQLFDTVVPVLYSWPSKGHTKDYLYDEDSADASVDNFIDLLQVLQMHSGIKRVHIIAHSMGNRIILNAMTRAAKPQSLAEVVFAAPDVDRDVFVQLAEKLRTITKGMTLYASAADKPLELKGWLASMPRAGDVTKDGPVIVKGVESIDMSVMGNDLLALNHSTFAASPVIEDIASLVRTGQHPPTLRTSRIRAVPERAATPRYWRYSP